MFTKEELANIERCVGHVHESTVVALAEDYPDEIKDIIRLDLQSTKELLEKVKSLL